MQDLLPEDMIADSAETKQMFLILNSKLDYIIHLLTGNGHKSVSELANTEELVRDELLTRLGMGCES